MEISNRFLDLKTTWSFKPANVGKVLAKRVQAKKRLSENPNDIEAMQMLSDADAQVIFEHFFFI